MYATTGLSLISFSMVHKDIFGFSHTIFAVFPCNVGWGGEGRAARFITELLILIVNTLGGKRKDGAGVSLQVLSMAPLIQILNSY